MANRCGSCNKFVGIEVGEPEIQFLSIDENSGEVSGEVRVVLNCADCGQELSASGFSFDDVPENVAEHVENGSEDIEHSLSIEEDSIEGTEELGGTDRRGKPITSYRYMKKFYGFSLSATVTCSCGWEGTVEFSDKEQASSFESSQ